MNTPDEQYAAFEADVQKATDAVCRFDPDAAAYRLRTEAWVRIALTEYGALSPPVPGEEAP